MKLYFMGAAKTVTGSCYLVELKDARVLIDCGMFQGTKELHDLNYGEFSFDPGSIDFLILTHSHLDHSGLIPRLVRDGFKGKILCSGATRDLSEIMLLDSAHIQELEAEWQSRKSRRAGEEAFDPLYTVADVQQAMALFAPQPVDEVITLDKRLSFRFREAGHILGSCIVELWTGPAGTGTKMVFSGDLGNVNQPIIRDPEFISEADILVIESTYGNRVHEDRQARISRLSRIVKSTLAAGGNVIIPAFAVARTQDVVYDLAVLARKGELKDVKIFIDSPLAVGATEIFSRHRDAYDVEMRHLLSTGYDPFNLPGLTYIQTTEESRALNDIKGGAIIISASGMCDFGRIKHHLKHNLWREESTILFVGFQAKGTLGRRLVDGEKKVKIFNEEIAVRANIEVIDGYSAHADKDMLLYWVKGYNSLPRRVFVTHGEEDAAGEFKRTLESSLGLWVYVPGLRDAYDIESDEIIYAPGTADIAREKETLDQSIAELKLALSQLERHSEEWKTMRDAKTISELNRQLKQLARQVNALAEG
ncbi:MAG TPA: MBL fold metallo-hydrolase [Firmicutes bacterium]|nr:MBL fold metallo-hydrolase [Bacillota bacterium]